MIATSCRNRNGFGKAAILATSIASLCVLPWEAKGQFEITTGVGNTAQNFDGLISTGTGQPWGNDTTLTLGDSTLDGWSLFNSLGSPITAYSAGAGGSNTGSFYSFGADSVGERALGGAASGGAYFGSPASGAIAGYIAFAATNTSTATLTSFTVQFNGEQWRDGGNTTPQTMVLEYGFGATFDAVTWTAPGGSFDWTSPIATTTGAAVNGNSAGLVAGLGGSVTALNWTTGQTLWIRWIERNDFGNDHGLAIDNFGLSWTGAVIVNQYWDINGATSGIGGTGSWSTGSLTWNLQENGTGATQAFDPSGRLIFGGAAGTVTIDTAGVTVNGPLRFDTSGYTIAAAGAGKLTLGGSAIEISDGVINTNISAPISGTNGLLKTGSGPLQLSGANDFTGVIAINNGALVFDQDIRLGNANNAIVLSGGVLAPSASIALASTRNTSGSGTLRVQIGQTLTFNGNVSLGSTVLASNDATHANGGEVNLSGVSNSLGAVTFDDPVRVTAPNGVTLTGDVTMPNVTNTVRITGQVTLAGNGGVRKFTVVDTPQDVDFLFDGGVLGTSRLHKVGDGTMTLQGNNSASFTGGIRLGTAGAAPESGGRLIIDDLNDLGTGATQQIQFNDGRLHSLTNLTGANAIPVGVSLGAGQLAPAIFSGSPMEFTGLFQLFKPANMYQHRVQLDTDVTFAGAFDSTGVSDTTPVGLQFTGTGTATFKAATNSAIDPLEIDGPTVSINGTLTSPTAAVVVKSGRFGGNATLAGALSVGDGIGAVGTDADDAFLSPGDGIGTLSALTLSFESDAVLKLEINSNVAGPGADKVTIGGLVTLGPVPGPGLAKLEVSDLGSTLLSTPLTLTIIENTSTDATTGIFEGLPDGSTLLIGANLFRIEYDFGPDANDIALVLVPEPSAISGLMLGLTLFGLRRRRSVKG